MVNNNNRKDHRNSTCYSCGKGFISPFAGELTMTRTPSVISIIHYSSPILVLFNIKSHQDWSYHTSIIHGQLPIISIAIWLILCIQFCRSISVEMEERRSQLRISPICMGDGTQAYNLLSTSF